MKIIGPQRAITSYQRWQVTPAKPTAIHVEDDAAELAGIHVCGLLDELDGYLWQRMTPDAFAGYQLRIQELMTRMVIAQTDDIDVEHQPKRLS